MLVNKDVIISLDHIAPDVEKKTCFDFLCFIGFLWYHIPELLYKLYISITHPIKSLIHVSLPYP